MTKKLDDYAEKIAEAQRAFEANSAARAGVGKSIGQMAEQIKAVEAAIKEVENISMQVRILSINASVEAARAGVAGRGFAIVATEVGRLSQNTNTVIAKIEGSVGKLQGFLDSAVSDMAGAKALGAEFERQLNECVEEAKKLSESVQ